MNGNFRGVTRGQNLIQASIPGLRYDHTGYNLLLSWLDMSFVEKAHRITSLSAELMHFLSIRNSAINCRKAYCTIGV